MTDLIAFSRMLLKTAVVCGCLCVVSPEMRADEAEAAPAAAPAEAASGDAQAPAAAAAADHAASADTHTTAEAGHDAGGHGDAHHETGVPINFKGDLALWSLVTFCLFMVVLKKFAWGPMIQGLDLREAGIRKAIAEAEQNRQKSQALLAEYDQKLKAAEQTVQAMVAEARRDAERTSQDLIAAAQREVNSLRDRARDDINQARDTALAEVFATMNSQVVRATEHVLGRALTDSDQDRLVQEALAGISR